MALTYYTQDFRVYEETRDQPMPGPFPAPPIFWGKSPGDEVGINFIFQSFTLSTHSGATPIVQQEDKNNKNQAEIWTW